MITTVGKKLHAEDGGTGSFLAIGVAERDNSQLFRSSGGCGAEGQAPISAQSSPSRVCI